MSNVCYSKHSNSKKQKTRGRTKNLNASSGNKKPPCEIIESYCAWVGRDLKDHPAPTSARTGLPAGRGTRSATLTDLRNTILGLYADGSRARRPFPCPTR